MSILYSEPHLLSNESSVFAKSLDIDESMYCAPGLGSKIHVCEVWAPCRAQPPPNTLNKKEDSDPGANPVLFLKLCRHQSESVMPAIWCAAIGYVDFTDYNMEKSKIKPHHMVPPGVIQYHIYK